MSRAAAPDPQITALIRTYQAAKARLDVVARNTSGDYTRARALRAIREIDQIISGLQSAQTHWANTVVPDVYVDRRLRNIDLLARNLQPYVRNFNLDFSLTDQRRVALAVQATLGDLTQASQGMRSYYGGWVMRAGFVEGAVPDLAPALGFSGTGFDRQMTQAITQGIAAGESRIQTSNTIRDMLNQQTLDGGRIAIRCVDGIVRQYDPASYAELVARTRTREIATDSTRQTMIAANEKYGIEPLYEVTHTPSECSEIGPCSEIDGKKFAERDDHPEYEWIGNVEIPVHPNCDHNLTPLVELSADDKAFLAQQEAA